MTLYIFLLSGISPETHLILEHAFCEHNSAKSLHQRTTVPLLLPLLLLPVLSLLLMCRP